MSLQRIKALFQKEIRQALRDKRMRMLIFGAPLIQLILFGYAVNTDVHDIRTVVCDRCDTSISRGLVDAFQATGYFQIVKRVREPRTAEPLLDKGEVQVILVIPEDFSRALQRGRPADLQMIVEGTDSIVASTAVSYGNRIIAAYLQKLKERHPPLNKKITTGRRSPRIRPEIRIWFNPDLKSRNFFVPGVIALLLTLISLILTSFSIVREWEVGTMEQLIVTPLRPAELIAGKTLPFFLLGLINLALIFVVGTLWFRIPFQGDVLLLAISAVLYLITALGIGILISTISRTQQQALMGVFFYFMPSVLLTGFVFPVYNIPAIVRWLAYINPMTYFLVIVRGVFLKGVGIAVLWPQLLFLTIAGPIFLGISIKRFHKKLD
ncbi:MAG: ABC transporter permease [Deltaproteobacteria bacterium]|nr:ABC transporter permease [Deltaproteobacteria bacterium]